MPCQAPETAPACAPEALFDARQERLLKLAEVDPEIGLVGLAICRGLDAARRLGSGDANAREELERALDDAVRAAGDRT